jgi:hypothetical protein
MDTEVDLNVILKNLREIIGTQAQEIAILKATIESKPTADS